MPRDNIPATIRSELCIGDTRLRCRGAARYTVDVERSDAANRLGIDRMGPDADAKRFCRSTYSTTASLNVDRAWIDAPSSVGVPICKEPVPDSVDTSAGVAANGACVLT